jgi:hypothetical protein
MQRALIGTASDSPRSWKRRHDWAGRDVREPVGDRLTDQSVGNIVKIHAERVDSIPHCSLVIHCAQDS